MRIYLDACCLNRPFDDQQQARVDREARAVLAILERVKRAEWTLLSSAVLEFELSQARDETRRARMLRLLIAATESIELGRHETDRAEALQQTYGFRAFDALHLACAESLRAEVFLTTDDRLLRACRRLAPQTLSFPVANPLVWLTEVSDWR